MHCRHFPVQFGCEFIKLILTASRQLQCKTFILKFELARHMNSSDFSVNHFGYLPEQVQNYTSKNRYL